MVVGYQNEVGEYAYDNLLVIRTRVPGDDTIKWGRLAMKGVENSGEAIRVYGMKFIIMSTGEGFRV